MGLPRRLWRRRSRSDESEPEVVPATPVVSVEDNDTEHVSVVGFPRRLWRRSRPTIGSEPDVVPTTPERSTEGDEVDVTVAAHHDPTRNQPVLTSLLTTRGTTRLVERMASPIVDPEPAARSALPKGDGCCLLYTSRCV